MYDDNVSKKLHITKVSHQLPMQIFVKTLVCVVKVNILLNE